MTDKSMILIVYPSNYINLLIAKTKVDAPKQQTLTKIKRARC